MRRAAPKAGPKPAQKPAPGPATQTAVKAEPKPLRPVLLVLAGVNGAGKSSIGGQMMLRRAGLSWFNPDTFARRVAEELQLPVAQANALAWQYGLNLLDRAVAAGHSHAFETTLGGRTMMQRMASAARTHDVLVWFCSLSSPEQHMSRVAQRVAAGGHHIPEAKIRERWVQAPLNLIELMPALHELRVYDNSADAAPGQAVEDPLLVLHVQRGQVKHPLSVQDLRRTPVWAKPLVQAARDLAQQATAIPP